MALAYLLDPCLQHQNRAGVNNVDGWFEVFRMDTDDRATIYTDFNGTLAPARNVIDNNGRVVMIAESGVAYRVAMYLPNGELVYTQQPVFTVGSGGGAGGSTEITSSDGSINVDRTSVGADTTFDISVARDGQDLLEYVRCDGATQIPDSYIYLPTYTEGTIAVGEKGLVLSAGHYYHVTAHVRATKSVQRSPFYDEVNIRFVLDNGTAQTDCVVEKRIVDYSLGLSQEFEVSTDVMPSSNCELLFVIDGQDAQNGSFQLLDVEAHRVYSGAPNIPSGVLSRVQAREIYQPILTAGENITIENNVISATGGGSEQVQSDWTESDTDAKSFIRHKPHTKPVVAGSNITIEETSTQFVISATAEPQEQANWAESDSSSVQYIQNKPDLSIYATTQAMNTALAGKQDVISDLATIRSGAALGATATQPSDLAAGLATKQDVISDLATIRSGAALGSTSVQPADLAPYATTSDMNTALAGKQDTLTAGSNISIVNNVISATAAPQQQADWEEGDTSSVQYIQHKPDLSVYATDSELTAGLATKQDVISDLATIRSGAALGTTSVQPADLAPYATTSSMNTALAGKQDVISDLSDIRAGAALGDTAVQPSDLATVATTGDYDDLTDKPDLSIYAESADLATVATTGSYADLTNTPSIPTATSDLTNDSGFITYSDIPVTDVTVNGTSVVSSGTAAVTVPTATSDLNNDSGFITLNDVPAQVNADWDSTSGVSEILNKPDLSIYAETANLATVATTGDYDDLVNKPTIPAAQVNSDWNSSSGVSQILNKPTLAAVATTGDYDDLLNKPSIPAAQVNADWASTSGVSEILNKPSLAAVATSGDYSDLSNTPSIPTATSDLTNDSGFITSSDIPVTDVEVDGVSVVSQGVASITLPSVPVTDVTVNGTSVVSNGTAAVTVPTATSQLTNDSGFITSVAFPVTDVQVNGTSVVNANGVAEVDLSSYATTQALTNGLAGKQDTISDLSTIRSGAALGATSVQPSDLAPYATTSAMNAALADKQDTLTAGTNVSITNNVISATDTTYTAGTGIEISNNEISVETPVDIVAGPGIVIDNPDGNTLRVSVAQDMEVIFNGTAAASVTCSESVSNFTRLRVYVKATSFATLHEVEFDVADSSVGYFFMANAKHGYGSQIGVSSTTVAISGGRHAWFNDMSIGSESAQIVITKVVGIHRIANN